MHFQTRIIYVSMSDLECILDVHEMYVHFSISIFILLSFVLYVMNIYLLINKKRNNKFLFFSFSQVELNSVFSKI